MPYHSGEVYAEDQGRVCTTCQEWKPFITKDGKKEFHRTRGGFRAKCVSCVRMLVRTGAWISYCAVCNEAEVPKNNGVCSSCRKSSKRAIARGICYLIVHDPDDGKLYKGAHFTEIEAYETLRLGYFPEGMLIEIWKSKVYKGCFEVAGQQMLPQELGRVAHDPIGDGIYLIPGKVADNGDVCVPRKYRPTFKEASNAIV